MDLIPEFNTSKFLRKEKRPPFRSDKKYRNWLQIKFIFSSKLKIILFIAFNVLVPALLGIVLQGFWDRKSGIKYYARKAFFQDTFYLAWVVCVADMRIAWLV